MQLPSELKLENSHCWQRRWLNILSYILLIWHINHINFGTGTVGHLGCQSFSLFDAAWLLIQSNWRKKCDDMCRWPHAQFSDTNGDMHASVRWKLHPEWQQTKGTGTGGGVFAPRTQDDQRFFFLIVSSSSNCLWLTYTWIIQLKCYSIKRCF